MAERVTASIRVIMVLIFDWARPLVGTVLSLARRPVRSKNAKERAAEHSKGLDRTQIVSVGTRPKREDSCDTQLGNSEVVDASGGGAS